MDAQTTVIDAFVEEGDTISWAWCTAHRDRQLTASFRLHFQPDVDQPREQPRGPTDEGEAQADEGGAQAEGAVADRNGGNKPASPQNPFQRLSKLPHGSRCVASRAGGEFLVQEPGRLVLFYDNNYPGSKDKSIFFAFYVAKSVDGIPAPLPGADVDSPAAEGAEAKREAKRMQPVIRCSSSPVLEACLLAAEDPALAGSYGYMLEDPKNKTANSNRRPSQAVFGFALSGAAGGATAGALIAGPLGAVIGGVASAVWAGNARHQKEVTEVEIQDVRAKVRALGVATSGGCAAASPAGGADPLLDPFSSPPYSPRSPHTPQYLHPFDGSPRLPTDIYGNTQFPLGVAEGGAGSPLTTPNAKPSPATAAAAAAAGVPTAFSPPEPPPAPGTAASPFDSFWSTFSTASTASPASDHYRQQQSWLQWEQQRALHQRQQQRKVSMPHPYHVYRRFSHHAVAPTVAPTTPVGMRGQEGLNFSAAVAVEEEEDLMVDTSSEINAVQRPMAGSLSINTARRALAGATAAAGATALAPDSPTPNVLSKLLTPGANTIGQYFREQYTFVQSLTGICDQLVKIDRFERQATLPRCLGSLLLPRLVYAPLCRGCDRFGRIVRIPLYEGLVFSTRTRCPTLVCFEVLYEGGARGDGDYNDGNYYDGDDFSDEEEEGNEKVTVESVLRDDDVGATRRKSSMRRASRPSVSQLAGGGQANKGSIVGGMGISKSQHQKLIDAYGGNSVGAMHDGGGNSMHDGAPADGIGASVSDSDDDFEDAEEPDEDEASSTAGSTKGPKIKTRRRKPSVVVDDDGEMFETPREGGPEMWNDSDDDTASMISASSGISRSSYSSARGKSSARPQLLSSELLRIGKLRVTLEMRVGAWLHGLPLEVEALVDADSAGGGAGTAVGGGADDATDADAPPAKAGDKKGSVSAVGTASTAVIVANTGASTPAVSRGGGEGLREGLSGLASRTTSSTVLVPLEPEVAKRYASTIERRCGHRTVLQLATARHTVTDFRRLGLAKAHAVALHLSLLKLQLRIAAASSSAAPTPPQSPGGAKVKGPLQGVLQNQVVDGEGKACAEGNAEGDGAGKAMVPGRAVVHTIVHTISHGKRGKGRGGSKLSLGMVPEGDDEDDEDMQVLAW
jgi:hypothetical protein